MTDKELKDWCKTCDVEPPAMKFKCPECEHNTDKEQIMINGVDVSECEYLTYELEEDGQYYWFCNIAPVGGPDECGYRPECFYKKIFRQLARKTQIIDEIEEVIKPYQAQIELDALSLPTAIKSILERKTQECEELKERLVRTEEDLKYQCVDCMNCQSDRYRKALEEVEDIVFGDYEIIDPLGKQQILNIIINKAKGEE